VPKAYDVAFVGHGCPVPRDELLALIREQFREHFIGRAYFDEMARVYSASRVAFNRSIENDVNMRVFEAESCGSLLVTNDLAENRQDELFRNVVHLVTYREPGEMVERVRYYLGDADAREAIAAARSCRRAGASYLSTPDGTTSGRSRESAGAEDGAAGGGPLVGRVGIGRPTVVGRARSRDPRPARSGDPRPA
jgi:hypothetical protein